MQDVVKIRKNIIFGNFRDLFFLLFKRNFFILKNLDFYNVIFNPKLYILKTFWFLNRALYNDYKNLKDKKYVLNFFKTFKMSSSFLMKYLHFLRSRYNKTLRFYLKRNNIKKKINNNLKFKSNKSI